MVFLVMDLRQDTDINGRQKNTSTIIQMHIERLFGRGQCEWLT